MLFCFLIKIISGAKSVVMSVFNRSRYRQLHNHSQLLINVFKRFYSTTSSIEQLISQNTEVSRDHMTPEISLHLITRNCRLWHEKGDDSPFVDPFWAFYWPGGQVLTRFVDSFMLKRFACQCHLLLTFAAVEIRCVFDDI